MPKAVYITDPVPVVSAVCSGCGREDGHAATCPVPKTWPACRFCAGCGRAKGNVPCPFCEGRGRLEPTKGVTT